MLQDGCAIVYNKYRERDLSKHGASTGWSCGDEHRTYAEAKACTKIESVEVISHHTIDEHPDLSALVLGYLKTHGPGDLGGPFRRETLMRYELRTDDPANAIELQFTDSAVASIINYGYGSTDLSWLLDPILAERLTPTDRIVRIWGEDIPAPGP